MNETTRNGDQELLYNGIRLPAQWPPKNNEHWFENGRAPMPVPYLESSGIPKVIPINVGRQLFVDDFLIEETTLTRTYHRADKHPENPLVAPERDYEDSSVYLVGEPCLWDPDEGLFKMWYAPAHWVAPRALLLSHDGLNWWRPVIDDKIGSNTVMPNHSKMAICSIIPDFNSTDQRYKAHGWEDKTKDSIFLISSDGIHWTEVGRLKNDYQDTTNIFYNPFRKKWVYNPKIHPIGERPRRRARMYAEVDTFDQLYDAETIYSRIIKWYRADENDDQSPELDRVPYAQIYDLFAVPYESMMLGGINVHYGPENDVCDAEQIPKLLQIHLGYSRDGFHWYRPTYEPFIPAQRQKGLGHREFGYLRPAGNVVNIVKDKLYFYYMAASGIDKQGNPGVYTGITINLATLRRDGFASMSVGSNGGTLLTRPVSFDGKHLFVNANTRGGALRIEVLSENMDVIEPFSIDQCIPVSEDSTCVQVNWKSGNDLAQLSGKPIRFRFHIQNGSLYAFWVSPDQSGASYGYVAGGGPGFTNDVDDKGLAVFND